MALFVLRKFILQTRMRSHPVALYVWCLVGSIIYFHTSRVQTAKALASARMRRLAWAFAVRLCKKIRTIISWAGSFAFANLIPVHFWSTTHEIDWCRYGPGFLQTRYERFRHITYWVHVGKMNAILAVLGCSKRNTRTGNSFRSLQTFEKHGILR